MAMNKQVFKTKSGPYVKPAVMKNKAGGLAYQMDDKHALVQLAVTGCFNNVYYDKGFAQLDEVRALCAKVEPEFVGKTAIYARKYGYMKDMPAYMVAQLAAIDIELFKRVFPVVIDNGTMLKKMVHVVRSGVTGRKSLGSGIKNAIVKWITSKDGNRLFNESVGGDVTLADLIKMVHAKPTSDEQNALFGYLIGKEFAEDKLPSNVRAFEQFKRGGEAPERIPFQFISSAVLAREEDESDASYKSRTQKWKRELWDRIAKDAPWHRTRMNLNNMLKYGVFEDNKMIKEVAQRLKNPELISKARVFPYQLLTAFLNVKDEMPMEIKLALQEALEVAVSNVPTVEGSIMVAPDVSGSMHSPVTGDRGYGATTSTMCVHVAGLVASVFLRNNKMTKVYPFSHGVERVSLNPMDSVMTNAKKLAQIGGGATVCSAPIRKLNQDKADVDLVVFVSDNQSWLDSGGRRLNYDSPAMAEEWARLQKRCPDAKLVCIDIQPYTNVQVEGSPNVLNIGGFSDRVFEVVNMFLKDELTPSHLVGEIEKIDLG
jgi:60 kDa SS-A/Ro ribonucleoprotein